jgi:polyhydroxyalkanoic acid synthase PhaR subunit
MIERSIRYRGGEKVNKEYNFYEIWKDFYSQSSNIFDEKMQESFPAEGLGQILEMNLQFKKMIDETTERYLEFVNMPTRTDLANLSSLIVNVDAKVDDLEELLEEAKDNQGEQAALKNEFAGLKKEMKNLDTKLTQIMSLLKVSQEAK